MTLEIPRISIAVDLNMCTEGVLDISGGGGGGKAGTDLIME